MARSPEQTMHNDLNVLKWIAGVSMVVVGGLMLAFLTKMWEVPTDIAVIKSDIGAVRQRQDQTDGETYRWRENIQKNVEELQRRIYRDGPQ